MRSIALALAALALISAKEQAQTAAPGVEPAMLYTGGPIITMAGNTPQTVEAIAVEDGKIIAVGTLSRVAYQAGKATLSDAKPMASSRTARLHDPVPVPPEGKGKDYRVYPAIDLKLFSAKLAEAAKNGWQVFVHVNGDEAAQALIDGVRTNGLSGKRTIAIHNQVVRPEQLRAMKAIDIQQSFFANGPAKRFQIKVLTTIKDSVPVFGTL